ncbi:MAG: type III-A CRISPR-associated RAMP protein Csm4 [Paludibacter sp. 47-17]|nr:MAG: type III-A CRISPR-associated RAMP protein Csm4 [Paludibacter sp. 47-17]
MKTKFKVYRLHFTTPLHIGDARDDYSVSLKTYQSDAMYAALTSCLAKVGKEIPKNGDLGFTISSLFPFYQKDEYDKPVYFLPKLLKQKLPKLENNGNAKKVKKVGWLDISYFEKLIGGVTLFEDGEDLEHIKGDFLTASTIEREFMSSQVSQRVTISRDLSENAEPFYMDRIYFKDQSGLYFIVSGDTKLLDGALEVLKDEGIGTDRNVGNGYFTFNSDEIEIDLPKSDYISNLSMFCPESEIQLKDMIDDKNVAYDFTKRGGWITTTPHNSIRKNSIHMFTPASIFKALKTSADIDIMGKIVNLNPAQSYPGIDHPIWRNGKSIFIPVKI